MQRTIWWPPGHFLTIIAKNDLVATKFCHNGFKIDNLVAIRLFFHDDCEMDDLAVAKLFF
jgi:hypothetical protein